MKVSPFAKDLAGAGVKNTKLDMKAPDPEAESVAKKGGSMVGTLSFIL